jgi:hypothetical protein
MHVVKANRLGKIGASTSVPHSWLTQVSSALLKS